MDQKQGSVMKARLCIGIFDLSPSWRAVLNALGVWYEEVDLTHATFSTAYSVIILNGEPDRPSRQKFQEFVEHGGAILEVYESFGFTPKEKLSQQFLKSVINRSTHEGFFHQKLLDLHSHCSLHKDSDLFDGLINLEASQKGMIGFFGADLPALMQDQHFRRKRFYHTHPPYPDEIVSTVSKHELLDTFECLLKELHFKRDLPYVKKWTSPTKKPVFCFRIDSDFGDKRSITDLHQFLETYKIKATWFLHVQAHEQWLEAFKDFNGHEIALHGYRHGTSKSESKIKKNIELGLQKLKEAGFEAEGFCAPYGIWNHGLISALKAFDFSYTSEFTFAGDGIPFQPDEAPLQIPIHPISTGSLSRKRYSEPEMANYFEQTVARKSGRFEPVLFYHHPLQPGLQAFKEIFEKVIPQNFIILTFSEFASFWKSRNTCSFEAFYDSDQVNIPTISDKEQLVQVCSDHKGFNVMQAENSFEIKKTPEFHYSNSYLPDPDVISELRKRDLRLIKTSLLDWKNRIRL